MKAIQGFAADNATHLLSGAAALLIALSSAGLIHIDPAKLQAILVLLGSGAASALHERIKAAKPVAKPASGS